MIATIAGPFDFVSDAWDAVTGVAGDVVDTFGSVAAKIPFAPELAGALKDVINGPLKDVADTAVGQVILRAMATTVAGPIAILAGPQLASVAFAIPGVARGEDFWTAWFQEVKWRAEKTAEIAAPGVEGAAADAMRPYLADLDTVADAFKDVAPSVEAWARSLGVDEAVKRFAVQLGVTEWSVQKVMAKIWGDWVPQIKPGDFDPITNKRTVAKASIATSIVDLPRRTTVMTLSPPPVAVAFSPSRIRQYIDPAWRTDLSTPAPIAPAPVAVAARAPSTGSARRAESPSGGSTLGNVALVGAVAIAVGALAWFYVPSRRR